MFDIDRPYTRTDVDITAEPIEKCLHELVRVAYTNSLKKLDPNDSTSGSAQMIGVMCFPLWETLLDNEATSTFADRIRATGENPEPTDKVFETVAHACTTRCEFDDDGNVVSYEPLVEDRAVILAAMYNFAGLPQPDGDTYPGHDRFKNEPHVRHG